MSNLHNKIKLYNNQITQFSENISKTILELSNLLFPILERSSTIYITGIGKSNLIAKKTVATWQSINIKAYNLLVQDLLHGDIGIIKKGDVIIYISNSGNTTELVEVAKYIKNIYSVSSSDSEIRIMQICISNNENNMLNNYVDYSYSIGPEKIIEADNNNIVPTVSSVLFLMLTDLLGIELSEKNNFTKEDFKKNHPCGLGSQI